MTEVEPRRGVVVGAAARSWDVVGRLLSLAASVRRGTLKLAVAGAAAAGVIVYFLVRDGLPGGAGRALLTILGVVVVVLPPLVLGAFWFVVGQLLLLPDRLRGMPAEGREHAAQLRRVVEEARSRRGRTAVPAQLWRLARLSTSARELLTPYAPLAPLMSVPFLAAVVLSALAVGVELVVALVLVLVAALG